MEPIDYNKAQGHMILAHMGKRVLRPGGRALTERLIEQLRISPADNIVEFAPGLGFTAAMALCYYPASYTGVEADPAFVKMLSAKLAGRQIRIIQADAAQSGLEDSSKDMVYGEAMLTMHAGHRKSAIIQEAQRILKKGGLYAIHELALTPDTMDEKLKATIQQELARAIRVNARPLTLPEWKTLLEQKGFVVKKTLSNAMHLLEPGRMVRDEGLFRTLKIGFNVMTHPAARQRIMSIRRVFRKYEKHIHAIAIICEKQ